MEVPTGLEPMMTELQSVALPTWPRNHFLILFRVSYHAASLLYAIKNFFAIVFYLVDKQLLLIHHQNKPLALMLEQVDK